MMRYHHCIKQIHEDNYTTKGFLHNTETIDGKQKANLGLTANCWMAAVAGSHAIKYSKSTLKKKKKRERYEY